MIQILYCLIYIKGAYLADVIEGHRVYKQAREDSNVSHLSLISSGCSKMEQVYAPIMNRILSLPSLSRGELLSMIDLHEKIVDYAKFCIKYPKSEAVISEATSNLFVKAQSKQDNHMERENSDNYDSDDYVPTAELTRVSPVLTHFPTAQLTHVPPPPISNVTSGTVISSAPV